MVVGLTYIHSKPPLNAQIAIFNGDWKTSNIGALLWVRSAAKTIRRSYRCFTQQAMQFTRLVKADGGPYLRSTFWSCRTSFGAHISLRRRDANFLGKKVEGGSGRFRSYIPIAIQQKKKNCAIGENPHQKSRFLCFEAQPKKKLPSARETKIQGKRVCNNTSLTLTPHLSA